MNKAIVLVLVIIGFVQLSSTQAQLKYSTEVHNHWAICGIIKVVYVYATEKLQENSWKNFLADASLFLTGLLIGGWLIYTISKKKIYLLLKVEKKNYLNKYSEDKLSFVFKYIGVVYLLKKQKDSYKKDNKNNRCELTKLRDKIKRLENKNTELLYENIELGEKIEEQNTGKQSIKTDSNTVEEQPEQLTKIYFSMPEIDGRFQISNGELSNDGKKYFIIEYEELSNRGELSFLSEERDQRAINRLESYLKPVCDIENISNSATATRIELIQNGKVSLINDSWVIDTDNKIKIKLY